MRPFYLIFFIPFYLKSQAFFKAKLADGKPFIEHKVDTKETLFGLSRKYAISPKEIASFNQFDANKSLQVNEVVRIPLNATNMVFAECESCCKIFYEVMPKEGLYRIGVNFQNVGMATLRKLNNLVSDDVKIGQNLLVGYLKGSGINTPKENIITEKKQPIETVTTEKKQDNVEVKAAENKATVDLNKTVDISTEEPKQVVYKEPIKNVIRENDNVTDKNSNAFASYYKFKGNKFTGTSAIFRSTSGWQDGKYYVLMNSVEAGTVVKVTNISNNKSIYAKVLGELPSIKQNEGILLRISNAAASILGNGEDNIQVEVTY